MTTTLRMTEAQHCSIQQHLFPGDGNEAMALLDLALRTRPS
jgi:hypothetical protein